MISNAKECRTLGDDAKPTLQHFSSVSNFLCNMWLCDVCSMWLLCTFATCQSASKGQRYLCRKPCFTSLQREVSCEEKTADLEQSAAFTKAVRSSFHSSFKLA